MSYSISFDLTLLHLLYFSYNGICGSSLYMSAYFIPTFYYRCPTTTHTHSLIVSFIISFSAKSLSPLHLLKWYILSAQYTLSSSPFQSPNMNTMIYIYFNLNIIVKNIVTCSFYSVLISFIDKEKHFILTIDKKI